MPLLAAKDAPQGLRRAKPVRTPITERHRRVRLSLECRFMRPDKTEYPTSIIDISVSHVTLSSPVSLPPDERVIAYVEHLGRLEGTVSKVFERSFEMCLNITTRKREKLAAQLTWLINRSQFEGLEERLHERVPVQNKIVKLRIADQPPIECRLLDVSKSGASLNTLVRPEVGTEVIVGKQRAVVRRHHDKGIGVQFLQVQEAHKLQTLLS